MILPVMKVDEMILRIHQGDTLALAKAITMVENHKKDYKKLLEKIYPLPDRAFKIGITGAPGFGKSSLIDKMITGLKKQSLLIAVLAVDPSSPLSGGALLGDRLRMIQHSNNANVFIRSIANRGYPGGLSLFTHEIVDLLQAAGKEIIIIETVGVGQSEIEAKTLAIKKKPYRKNCCRTIQGGDAAKSRYYGPFTKQRQRQPLSARRSNMPHH